MLMLDVRVDVPAEIEKTLFEWYFSHVPHLMLAEGYESSRRYVAVDSWPKYQALYEIRDESYVPSLLGSDLSKRHPMTMIDGPAWIEKIDAKTNHFCFAVYEPTLKDSWPLLDGDYPIVEIRFNTDERERPVVRDLVERQVVPVISLDRDVVRAQAFEAVEGDHIMWIGKDPWTSNMILVQLHGERAIPSLVGGQHDALESLRAARGVTDVQIAGYRQIARWWPLPPLPADAA